MTEVQLNAFSLLRSDIAIMAAYIPDPCPHLPFQISPRACRMPKWAPVRAGFVLNSCHPSSMCPKLPLRSLLNFDIVCQRLSEEAFSCLELQEQANTISWLESRINKCEKKMAHRRIWILRLDLILGDDRRDDEQEFHARQAVVRETNKTIELRSLA